MLLINNGVTLQLFCYNTKAAYAKLKKADKHSDVLLDLNHEKAFRNRGSGFVVVQ